MGNDIGNSSIYGAKLIVKIRSHAILFWHGAKLVVKLHWHGAKLVVKLYWHGSKLVVKIYWHVTIKLDT